MIGRKLVATSRDGTTRHGRFLAFSRDADGDPVMVFEDESGRVGYVHLGWEIRFAEPLAEPERVKMPPWPQVEDDHLVEEIERLRAEVEQLKSEIEQLRKESDNARAEKEWVITRIDAELSRIGLTLLWTDGGGKECPTGWHRNPYIPGCNRVVEQLRTEIERLKETKCLTIGKAAEACPAIQTEIHEIERLKAEIERLLRDVELARRTSASWKDEQLASKSEIERLRGWLAVIQTLTGEHWTTDNCDDALDGEPVPK